MAQADDPFQEIEQLVDQVIGFGGALGQKIPVDVVDTDDEVVVRADLPGRDPDGIHVQLRDSRELHIEAAPPTETDEFEGRYLTRERPERSVTRTVRLPTMVEDGETSASYEHGVLTVSLPKPSGGEDGTEIPVE